MLIQKDALKSLLLDQDQLICVLDAARYDIFEQVNWLPGKLEKAVSAGSTTTEWAVNTFPDFYPRAVYISSVPYIAAKIVTEQQKAFLGLEHFQVVNDVWDWGYDDETSTVLPETVAHATLQAKKDYPDRVIIAHFMQPHCPYIGSPPLTLNTWKELVETRVSLNGFGSITTATIDGFPPLSTIFERGYGDLLKRAYRGNLVRALEVIERELASQFSNITITADHGEGFGEGGVYGHGAGIRTPELLSVPWFNLT